MRVGLLVYALDRPLTGIGRYTMELGRALCRLEPSVELALLTAGNAGTLVGGGRVPRAPLPGCRLLPGLVTLGNLLIPRAVRRLELDIVHDPTGVTPFLFGAAGARTVVTIHDVIPWSYPGASTRLDALIYRHWLPRVLLRVDAVIADSQATKTDIIRYMRVTSEKIQVVPGGVADSFQPAPASEIDGVRGKYQLPEGYILFVGSVEKRKNLTGLMRACTLLRRMGSLEPVVIAGSAARKYPELQATLRELGLEQDVRLVGYVSEPDLATLYSGARVFVFPSLYEGFGLPPLEAMACGTPVVCSNRSSLPEVVGDAALMVDPDDVEGLAEAMRRVLSDADLREEMRSKGLARARQFPWEHTARATIEVYRQVVA
jgi:glycosyltransferase involved in cell wall biosynthesis